MERLIYVVLTIIVLAAGFETVRVLSIDTQKNIKIILQK